MKPNYLFNSQADTCAAIRAELAKHNVFVELGTGLEALEQDDEKVVVQLSRSDGGEMERAEFRYLFGLDGGRGMLNRTFSSIRSRNNDCLVSFKTAF